MDYAHNHTHTHAHEQIVASLKNLTHDHLIYNLVEKIFCIFNTLHRQMGTDKGDNYVFFREMTLFGVGSDRRLSTAALLPPGVTPDASYSASLIRSRANIGRLINPLECSSAF